MKKSKFLSLYLILFILSFLSACLPVETGPLKFSLKGLKSQEALEGTNFSELEATYTNVRKYIFEDKCLGCHKTGRARAEVNLSEYKEIFGYSEYFQPIVTKGDPDASGVYTEVARGAMPPKKANNPLTEEEVEFIKRWIEEGALE